MDKIDKLIDAMEHPESYSDPQIEAILKDPELKEVLDLLDKTKTSLKPIVIPDIDDEWKNFETSHKNYETSGKFGFRDLFSGKIAASIAVGIVSVTAMAAIVGISVGYFDHKEAASLSKVEDSGKNSGASQISELQIPEETEPTATETVIFDNVPFETIILKIGEYYGYTVRFDTDKARSLRLYYRWNQALPLEDVVERLNNFEQIHLSIKGNVINID